MISLFFVLLLTVPPTSMLTHYYVLERYLMEIVNRTTMAKQTA